MRRWFSSWNFICWKFIAMFTCFLTLLSNQNFFFSPRVVLYEFFKEKTGFDCCRWWTKELEINKTEVFSNILCTSFSMKCPCQRYSVNCQNKETYQKMIALKCIEGNIRQRTAELIAEFSWWSQEVDIELRRCRRQSFFRLLDGFFVFCFQLVYFTCKEHEDWSTELTLKMRYHEQ